MPAAMDIALGIVRQAPQSGIMKMEFGEKYELK